MKNFLNFLLVTSAVAAPLVAPGQMPQARAASAQDARGTVTLPAGTGRLMHLRAPADSLFVADPKVVEVKPASKDTVFVYGVGPGITTIAALTREGESIAQFQVRVIPSQAGAEAANDGLHAAGPARAPLHAQASGNGITLEGTSQTAREATLAVNAAKAELPPGGAVVNGALVSEPQQVNLHVRVVEMDRTLVRALGVNWLTGQNDITGPGGTAYQNFLPAKIGQSGFFGVSTQNATVTTDTPSVARLGLNSKALNLEASISALAEDQLVHTLAEPNLTAMSGEPANFLVGGEFPVPSATANNAVSVDFKQYGISLSFVPTVLSRGSISLHVRPEVSALDKANGVTFYFNSTSGSGIVVPALTVRRADTTVMLGSGQSFVIAGLLSDQTSDNGQAVPGLGEVPILGPLFRSDSFQRQQSELVIIVTPYLVKPVSDPKSLHAPDDGWRPPSDIERIIYLRQAQPGWAGAKPERRISADAGFMVE